MPDKNIHYDEFSSSSPSSEHTDKVCYYHHFLVQRSAIGLTENIVFEKPKNNNQFKIEISVSFRSIRMKLQHREHRCFDRRTASTMLKSIQVLDFGEFKCFCFRFSSVIRLVSIIMNGAIMQGTDFTSLLYPTTIREQMPNTKNDNKRIANYISMVNCIIEARNWIRFSLYFIFSFSYFVQNL